MKPLTEKQRKILNFVRRYARERGFPPTLREIGDTVGPANISAVRGHLAALEKKGYIKKDPDKARSIRVVHAPSILSRFKRKLHEFARTDEGVIHRVTYGMVLATGGRLPHFAGKQGERLDEALDRRCAEHGWSFPLKKIEPDHVVLVVEAWPNHSPELVVSRVRQTGEAIWRRHPKDFPGKHLWAKGYAVTTDLEQLDELVGQFLEQVNQQGKVARREAGGGKRKAGGQ